MDANLGILGVEVHTSVRNIIFSIVASNCYHFKHQNLNILHGIHIDTIEASWCICLKLK